MWPLLSFFVELSLLRRHPQDLPAAWALVVALGVANVLVGWLGSWSYFETPLQALLASVVDALLLAGLLRATLGFAGHARRFVQTLTAFYGVGVLLGLVLLPVQMLGHLGLLPLEALLSLLALIWVHVVFGHVLRDALELDLWAGILIAIGFTMISLTLINTYLPPPVAAPGELG